MNDDIETLMVELSKSHAENRRLNDKLNIALQGLKVLFSEPTGIANKTLKAIQELDLPQESLEVEE